MYKFFPAVFLSAVLSKPAFLKTSIQPDKLLFSPPQNSPSYLSAKNKYSSLDKIYDVLLVQYDSFPCLRNPDSNTDSQCLVYFFLNRRCDLPKIFLQSVLVNCTDLFQQYCRIMFRVWQSVHKYMGGCLTQTRIYFG